MNLLVFNTNITAGKGFPLTLDDDEYGHLITEIFRARKISNHAYIRVYNGILVYEITGIYSNILKDLTSDETATQLVVLRRVGVFNKTMDPERFIEWNGLYGYDVERCWSCAASTY